MGLGSSVETSNLQTNLQTNMDELRSKVQTSLPSDLTATSSTPATTSTAAANLPVEVVMIEDVGMMVKSWCEARAFSRLLGIDGEGWCHLDVIDYKHNT